jgi:hypothetical protein
MHRPTTAVSQHNLKADYLVLVSSAETVGAFKDHTDFDTVNLHRPTRAFSREGPQQSVFLLV